MPYYLFPDCAVDGQREYLEDDLPGGCHRAEAGEGCGISVEESGGGRERRGEGRRERRGEEREIDERIRKGRKEAD
jgi:hypothetical protein